MNKIFKQKSRNGSVGLKVSDIVARLLLESGRVSKAATDKACFYSAIVSLLVCCLSKNHDLKIASARFEPLSAASHLRVQGGKK
jgi:hypothetical protein